MQRVSGASINVPEDVFYYLLGAFILNEKEKEGFQIIDRSKRELFILFLGYMVSVNLLSISPRDNYPLYV